MTTSTRHPWKLPQCFRIIHKVVIGLRRYLLLFTRPGIAVATEKLFP